MCIRDRAYTNIYFLLPRYIKHRSFPKYLTFLLSFVFLMSITRILLNYALVTTEIWPESERSDVSLFDFNYIVNVFVGELYVVGTTSAIWFAVEKVRETDLREKLEERRLRAELAYLKSQIQPPFFSIP